MILMAAVLTALAVFIAQAARVARVEGNSHIPCGDVNYNSRIDGNDVVLLNQLATGTGVEPTMHQRIIGDIDQNGALTTDDAGLLFQHFANLTEPQNCGRGSSIPQWRETLLYEAANSATTGNEIFDVGRWNLGSFDAVVSIDWETIRQKNGSYIIPMSEILVSDQRVYATGHYPGDGCPMRLFFLYAARGMKPYWLIVSCYQDSDELTFFVDELYNSQVTRVVWGFVNENPLVQIGRVVFMSLN